MTPVNLLPTKSALTGQWNVLPARQAIPLVLIDPNLAIFLHAVAHIGHKHLQPLLALLLQQALTNLLFRFRQLSRRGLLLVNHGEYHAASAIFYGIADLAGLHVERD